ncbi:MAG: ABC transporter permease subunit, partial [Spirochaetaceae bacterium]|nr:ABC transporter permease subunit [Spirochaetaceae bacterium]
NRDMTIRATLGKRILQHRAYYFFLLPGVVYFILFHYAPMFGLRWAFFDYDLRGTGDFVGFAHFRDAFTSEGFGRAFRNTLLLSSANIVIQMTLTITISLLLNEMVFKGVKKFVQTAIYLPHFLSWVVVGALFTLILSRQGGMVNGMIETMGGEKVYFLGDTAWWRVVYLFILAWREVGWGTVIFLASLSGIDPQLYEAAWIDGAGRWNQMWYVTLPHLIPVIVIVLIMNLAKIFNLFESVFVLYNPLVYSVSDVIQTYVYRTGLQEFRFGYSTAVGLFRSVIAFVLVMTANSTVKKIRGESAF